MKYGVTAGALLCAAIALFVQPHAACAQPLQNSKRKQIFGTISIQWARYPRRGQPRLTFRSRDLPQVHEQKTKGAKKHPYRAVGLNFLRE